jgi:D-alanyl-lipoteichoic acid acyltransferase DltB (MBOAT superfamily)
MLFNSLPFLLGFLPLTLLLWRLALHWGSLRLALAGLTGASLVFYAGWNPAYLPLLLGAILMDRPVAGRLVAARARGDERAAGRWLALGVGLNLALLGVFKYSWFIAANVTALAGGAPPFAPLILPLGISFFTFQKIAYLVDLRRGLTRGRGLLDYGFFVSFFPQLIAGPIVHHAPLMAQLDAGRAALRAVMAHWPLGLSLFALGLFKKVCLADSLAPYVGPAFDAPAGAALNGALAWSGMLAYSLQLYFDFSGYSDMALGLGVLFGLRLPVNFASPYQAASIIDFWRRWNLTLSAFLRDYVYIPLGGNRCGRARQRLNLLLTMLIGGLWHGAGWTFVLWGGLHGLMLLINHGWRDWLAGQAGWARAMQRVPRVLWVGLTFALVTLAWVPFRAPNLDAALRLLGALTQGPGLVAVLNGLPAPGSLGFWQGVLAGEPGYAWVWIGLGLGLVWLAPTGWRWLGYRQGSAPPAERPLGFAVGLLTALWLWLALKTLLSAPASEFLYFQF